MPGRACSTARAGGGGSIMGLLTSFLGWPDPRVERIAGMLGGLGQRFPGHGGAGVAGTLRVSRCSWASPT